MPFDALISSTAANYGLTPSLVAAVCEQESNFNPAAIRYEPAFYEHYVLPLNIQNPTEAQSRAFSWGIMQVMGEVAREFGFKGNFLSELCQPGTGLDIGCKVLKHKIDKSNGDVAKALLLWNGGGREKYPAEVLARQPKFAGLDK